MMGSSQQRVIVLQEYHKKTWRDKPHWYWMLGLLEEIGELTLSLLGLHKHPPEVELTQIAAICINWLEMREGMVNDDNVT